MTEKQNDLNWITKHELAFIDGLGTWPEVYGVSRRQLLQSYFSAIRERMDWGGISKSSVIMHIEVALLTVSGI